MRTQRSKAKNLRDYIVISVIVLALMSPYLWLICNTFRGASEPFAASVFPRVWTLDNYKKVLTDTATFHAIRNSLLCSVTSALLTVALAVTTAYGFSRYRFRGRKFLMTVFLCLRTFPALLLAITLFVWVVNAGLYDTYVPLVLANAMMNLPFAVWNSISIIDAVPFQVEESGMLDGLSRLGTIFKITLPMALPGLVATFTYVFIMSWNEYLFAMTFISSNSKQLITTKIASAIGQFSVDYAGLLTTSAIASVPIILLFIYIQQGIISGLSAGGVKE